MIPSPLKAANLKIAELTILLNEAKNLNKALFLDLETAGVAEETIRKYPVLAKKMDGVLKTGTDT